MDQFREETLKEAKKKKGKLRGYKAHYKINNDFFPPNSLQIESKNKNVALAYFKVLTYVQKVDLK